MSGWDFSLEKSLEDYNFVYKRVMIMPNSTYWPELYDWEWYDIDFIVNSTIEGML